jgi:hypothetical protein
MGVRFDRVLDALDAPLEGPFEVVTVASVPPGRIVGADGAAGFLFSHHQNDAFVAVNRLLKAGAAVYWLTDRTIGGGPGGTGAMYVDAEIAETGPAGAPIGETERVAVQSTVLPLLRMIAAERGVTFTGVRERPASATLKLRPVRVGLWDRHGGSSPSGWTRWLLERFEFPFEVVYAQAIDAGALADRFDVVILTDDAVPTGPGPAGAARAGDVVGGSVVGGTTLAGTVLAGAVSVEDARRAAAEKAAENARVPPEYRHTLGGLTWDRSVPRLKAFVERGGTLIAVGDATTIGETFGIVRSALVDGAGGSSRPLTRAEYYVPGSVLRVSVDNRVPVAYGFETAVDVLVDDSPVFRLQPEAVARGARRAAWFPNAAPLRSGWALGQRYLEGGVAVVDAPLGRGQVFLFGPEITFRAQSHGTFKFLFNAIYAGPATSAPAAVVRR